MSDASFVAAAYILTWVVLAVYTLYLIRRRRNADERLGEATSKTGGDR